MSGYQPLPDQSGYNQGYAYPQQAYGQPPAYAPQAYNPAYPPQAYAPSYQQPQPAAQPIVVNVTNNQAQHSHAQPVYCAPRTVFLGRSYDSDVAPALTIFIIGWFCCFVWAAGFRFIRSKNGTAKALGIASVVCFFLSIGAIVTVISVSVAAANAVNHASSYTSSYTQTVVIPGSSSASIYMSSVYSYATVTYSSGTWKASTQTSSTSSNGYYGVACSSASCPNQGNPLMELEASCSPSWSFQQATGNTFYCGGGYMYLKPNLPSTVTGSGMLSVTVTFWS